MLKSGKAAWRGSARPLFGWRRDRAKARDSPDLLGARELVGWWVVGNIAMTLLQATKSIVHCFTTRSVRHDLMHTINGRDSSGLGRRNWSRS